MLMLVACGAIPLTVLYQFLKTFQVFYHGLKVCISFGYNPSC